MEIPQYTLDDYETGFADRHRLHDVVRRWAASKPEATALVSAEGNRTLTWREFDLSTQAMAAELLRLGFGKGDFLVTLLPWSIDLVLLEYSCFRIGVIVTPLDLRLSAAEVMRAMELLTPRGFACLGSIFGAGKIRRAVGSECPSLRHWFLFGPESEIEDRLPGDLHFDSLAREAWRAVEHGIPRADAAALEAADRAVTENDGALAIFTTGSTGSPKPALLSHRSITAQNMCLCGAMMGGDRGIRALVHLPPSHVGGQSELLMSILFGGGQAVLMGTFDPRRALGAIAEHRIEILGQIPAMFQLEWMLKDYDQYDLSSLKVVVYGGSSVSWPFVERMATMAPVVGTGLGLTEASGFCTYAIESAADSGKLAAGLGISMPIYPCTIRQPMRDDGAAGEEQPRGEMGHVCFRGPQTFLGYVGDPETTAKTTSRDGYLYTGDLGFIDDAGLHLTGREKWVIKSFGYQVFPGDVEAHIGALSEKVASCVVVGVEHRVVSEAVVALVEKKPGVELSAKELGTHARSLAPYMRPRHWIILEPGALPLNRVAKPDYVRAKQMAREEIERLRAEGGWDSASLRVMNLLNESDGKER
jgi:acyl-CoA synthetase (AMP-forming)/AMP-acid ligase II